jgi:hypothetical protein
MAGDDETLDETPAEREGRDRALAGVALGVPRCRAWPAPLLWGAPSPEPLGTLRAPPRLGWDREARRGGRVTPLGAREEGLPLVRQVHRRVSGGYRLISGEMELTAPDTCKALQEGRQRR